jgi:hypothetical protein
VGLLSILRLAAELKAVSQCSQFLAPPPVQAAAPHLNGVAAHSEQFTGLEDIADTPLSPVEDIADTPKSPPEDEAMLPANRPASAGILMSRMHSLYSLHMLSWSIDAAQMCLSSLQMVDAAQPPQRPVPLQHCLRQGSIQM